MLQWSFSEHSGNEHIKCHILPFWFVFISPIIFHIIENCLIWLLARRWIAENLNFLKHFSTLSQLCLPLIYSRKKLDNPLQRCVKVVGSSVLGSAVVLGSGVIPHCCQQLTKIIPNWSLTQEWPKWVSRRSLNTAAKNTLNATFYLFGSSSYLP